ncbi:hypothetical protein C8Q79DRAFT_929418 [Trametes meyenii]|nr:hypothetical protein C8Q79DRAFT_929418 [Trametes meyenii]
MSAGRLLPPRWAYTLVCGSRRRNPSSLSTSFAVVPMISRLTRTGRIFSPYNLSKNFDAAQLVEPSILVVPVAPVVATAAPNTIPELPPATSPLSDALAGSMTQDAALPEFSLPPLLVDPTPVMAVDLAQTPIAPGVHTGAGSAATRPRKRGRSPGADAANHTKRNRRSRRKKQRAGKQPDVLSRGPPLTAMKHIDNAKVLSVPLRLHTLPIAKGAFVGKRQSVDKEREWTLEDLKADGFEVFEWDGIPRTPYILADAQERVVAVLAGRPEDTSWDEVVKEANRAMEATAKKCTFQEQHLNHRRGSSRRWQQGSHTAVDRRLTQTPGNFRNTPSNAAALDELCQNQAIKRIAGFGCTAYSLYAPKVHRSTCASLKKLCNKHPTLQFNFTNSMFPATTFNFGPGAVCIEHVDA